MTALGAAVMGGGLVLTGFIGQMWEGYLAYRIGVGVGVGVGAACAYMPTLAILGGWFTRQRNAALSTAAAGTGCGMLVVPPLSAVLIERFGWRVTSMIVRWAVPCCSPWPQCLPPPLPAAGVHRPLGGIVRSFEFLMLYASWVLATIALFVPFVFLPAYVAIHGGSQVAGAALLSLLGGVSILGRLGIGVFTDRIGTARLFKASVLLMAASYLIWIIAPSYVWLVGFAVTIGLGYGLRIALMPAVLIELFGVQNLGTILGIFFTASGISAVVGPLLAGSIVDATGSYDWGIAFALVAGTLGFAAVALLRIPRDEGIIRPPCSP